MYKTKKIIDKFNALRKLVDKNFNPTFICGISGSGTSLLTSLLDQRYHNATCINESALEIDQKSPLRMENTSSYGTLDNYYKNMFLDASVSSQIVYKDILNLYQKKSQYLRQSNLVIDKASMTHLVRSSFLKKAFPQAKFILVFREPIATIEGLRRKWPSIYRSVSVEKVCDFWSEIHHCFLKDTLKFQEEIIFIPYEYLVKETNQCLSKVAHILSLKERKIPKKIPNKENNQGKGLRNVKSGLIKIDKKTLQNPCQSLDNEEELISKKLSGLYDLLYEKAKLSVID